MSTPYSGLIVSSARANGVPPSLLAGLLSHESGFNPQATGVNTAPVRSTDRGIAQINNLAYPNVSNAQAYDPSYAIPFAAQKLAAAKKNCGTWSGALQVYNSGQCSGDPGYSSAVLSKAKSYTGLDLTPSVQSLAPTAWSSNKVVVIVLIVFALIMVVLAID